MIGWCGRCGGSLELVDGGVVLAAVRCPWCKAVLWREQVVREDGRRDEEEVGGGEAESGKGKGEDVGR